MLCNGCFSTSPHLVCVLFNTLASNTLCLCLPVHYSLLLVFYFLISSFSFPTRPLKMPSPVPSFSLQASHSHQVVLCRSIPSIPLIQTILKCYSLAEADPENSRIKCLIPPKRNPGKQSGETCAKESINVLVPAHHISRHLKTPHHIFLPLLNPKAENSLPCAAQPHPKTLRFPSLLLLVH